MEADLKKRKRFMRPKMRPAHVIVLGFFGVIVLGALLLCLPVSAKSGKWMSFLDAMFTATSAVSTTGLIVIPDTATYFSIFGQIVLIILIQFGGVGFMCITTLLMILLTKKITLKDRLLMRTEFNQDDTRGMVRLGRNIMLVTLAIEGVGFLLLIYPFVRHSGGVGVWQALFTSISAFCNAGFDILGTGNSLGDFVGSVTVNLSVSFLIVLGGFGFVVLMDIGRNFKNPKKLSLHSKVTIITTAALILVGFVFYFAVEYSRAFADMNVGTKMLAALFQSISPRNAGFATVDQNSFTSASKFMTMFLMFVGASPCSTGGGIRTTTFTVLILVMISGFWESDDIVVGKHKVNLHTARKAISVFIASLVIVIVSSLILLISEQSTGITFENILFECCSAYATTGLSCGLSAQMSAVGKIVLMLNMFIGRVGTVTVSLMFIRIKSSKDNITYPDGNITIG